MNIIPFGHKLEHEAHQISLISYNILLPNNTEGWWIPKCYPPETPIEHRTWMYRKEKIHSHLRTVAADIICLQEVAFSSWTEDFQELWDTGYEGVIHKKNNLFRCATWYRKDIYKLCETRHAFRTLVHLFQGECGYFVVINVHLSGGPQPRTRMAQLHEALNALKKVCHKHNIEPSILPVLLCGDFNCNPHMSPMEGFLSSGQLLPEERDFHYPNTALTKKGKKHHFSGFSNSYRHALGFSPPTLFGRPFISAFCIPHETKELLQARSNNTLHTLIKTETYRAIQVLFEQYAQGGVMDKTACVKWIRQINGDIRGGEWKHVERFNHQLALDDFIHIYVQNLCNGLWWSLASDLYRHGIPLPKSPKEMYHDALDHIFTRCCTIVSLQSPTLPTPIPFGLPCSEHPSDHIPLGIVVDIEKSKEPQYDGIY